MEFKDLIVGVTAIQTGDKEYTLFCDNAGRVYMRFLIENKVDKKIGKIRLQGRSPRYQKKVIPKIHLLRKYNAYCVNASLTDYLATVDGIIQLISVSRIYTLSATIVRMNDVIKYGGFERQYRVPLNKWIKTKGGQS